ncbi:MAG: 4Fe-4S dicluster domain-containing protein [Candidatus Caldatribacteriaceae bacterium]
MPGKFISLEECQKNIAQRVDYIFVSERAEKIYHNLFPSGVKILKTPKELLFPAWEKIYKYFLKDRNWQIQDVKDRMLSDPSFLFVLPCEAQAIIRVMDVNFIHNRPSDLTYCERRKKLHLVILGCLSQGETCFCHLVGGNPLWRDEKSIFLVPFEGQMYVENDYIEFFEKGKELTFREEQKVKTWENELKGRLSSPLPPDFPQKLYAYFENHSWQDIAWHCINCGACTFLCPTCYCFDISLEGRLRGFTLKTWDSCMFPKFTLHASSHNPRPTTKERVRQRVLHKFSYFPLREKYYGCVGCGVCREICPVNWDIREVVERMVKEIESGK